MEMTCRVNISEAGFKVKVIAGDLRSHVHNLCPLHISLTPDLILKTFHTIRCSVTGKVSDSLLQGLGIKFLQFLNPHASQI